MDRWIDAVLIGQGYALDYRVGQRADKEACWWRIVIRNGGLVSNWYWIGRYVKDWHSLGLEYDLHWDANCGVIWVAPSFMVKVMDDRPLPRLVCPLIVLVPLTKWGIVHWIDLVLAWPVTIHSQLVPMWTIWVSSVDTVRDAEVELVSGQYLVDWGWIGQRLV